MNSVKSGEKVDKLNTIFEELLEDARDLTKDLTGSVQGYFFLGCLAILFGIQFGWYVFHHFRDYNIITVTLFGVMIGAGIAIILKYFLLKKKYERLYAILHELRLS